MKPRCPPTTPYLLRRCLLAGGLALSCAAGAAPVLIDNFDTASQSLTVTRPSALVGSSQSAYSATGILGGYRDLWIAIDQSGTIFDASAKLSVQGGDLALDNDAGVDSAAVIQWDGNDLPPSGTTGGANPTPATLNLTQNGFAPVDLTGGSTNDRFSFRVDFQDGGFDFTITAYEGANAVSYTANTGAAFSTPKVFTLPFDQFKGPGNAPATAANFDAVTALSLTIQNTTRARDFRIRRLDATGDCHASIGDYVWLDANRDGIQNPNEMGNGINGVELILTTSTGIELDRFITKTGGPQGQPGYYQFPDFCAGDYVVTVNSASPALAGLTPTTVGVGNDPGADSNNPAGAPVNLPTNTSSDQTIDFGYYAPCTGTIGDYVWFDANRNGIQDSTEQGINDVEVVLRGAGGTETRFTTVTGGPGNKPGYYQFSGLCLGNYVVDVDLDTVPADDEPTKIGAPGSTVDNDSNDPAGTPVNLPTDTSSNQTIDFGFRAICTGTIGDYVWLDSNRNGIQDADETGLDGVKVVLLDSQGVITSTTTYTGGPGNKAGYYQFPGLCGGTYTVKVDPLTVPAGLEPTDIEVTAPPATPATDSNDPDGTDVTLPANNSSNQTIDFGYQSPCTGEVGDYVWLDTNGDGIQNDGATGIDGVQVFLKDSQGNVIRTTTTGTGGPNNTAGYYSFGGLCMGSYAVAVNQGSTPLTNKVPTQQGQGTPATDSNNPAGTPVVLPADNTKDLTIDFGFVPANPLVAIVKYTNGADANNPNGTDVPSVAVGGTVTWTYKVTNTGNVSVPQAAVVVTDNTTGVTPTFTSVMTGNADTSFDPGEVWLYTATGTALDLTLSPPAGVTTQANACTAGGASQPRTAYVNIGRVTIPGASKTDPSSYCNPANPKVAIIKYTNGQDANNPDGADVPNVAAGNPVIWTYKVTNTGNTTVPKANVTVTDNNGATPVYDSESSGNGDAFFNPGEVWLFKATGTAVNLAIPQPGLKTQADTCILGGTQPPRTAYVNTGTVTIPGDSATDPSSYCNPPSQQEPIAALGDFVWNDLNKNGQQDAGEPGLAGSTVTLWRCGPAGQADITLGTNTGLSQTTDGTGKYLFNNLVPACYFVTFTTPTGFTPTLANTVPDATDSDSVNGVTGPYTLLGGQENLTVDAGFYTSPPGMTIVKTVISPTNVPPTIAPYEMVTYGYTVTNTGGATLTNIVVTDDNGTPATLSDDFTVGTIPTLAPGASVTLTAGVIPVVTTTSVVNGNPVTAGAVIVVVQQADGNIKATYLQDFGINDNTYGTGSIGWPAGKPHTFGNLTGSDKLEFRFFDKAGNVVIDFYVDTITAANSVTVPGTGQVISYPSGYGTLGPFGGDGSMVAGDSKNLLSFSTSISENLNNPLNLPKKASLIVDSPTSLVGGNVVVDPIKAPGGWNSINNYSVVIKGSAFTAGGGFGGVAVPDQHNSPNKLGGPNGMVTEPKNSTVVNTATAATATSGGLLTATATASVDIKVVSTPTQCAVSEVDPTFDRKEMRWPITNKESSKVILSQVTVTWPATNGYLDKVKLGGDVVWDGTINCVSGTCSATLTSALLTTDAKKKTIDPGKTEQLTFVFEKNANTSRSLYSASASFGSCIVTFGTPPVACTGVIGDFVWDDLDQDGTQDATEPGLSNVTLVLKQGATVKATTTTNGSGEYLFTQVCAGTYTVEVTRPNGYAATLTEQGGDDGIDSNPNPATVVLVGSNDSNLTIDFGFVSTGGTEMCVPAATAGQPPVPVGTLFVTDQGANIAVRYEQSRTVNDNSYGTNAVGWAAGHKFSDLTGSDKAEFIFTDGSGAKKLDFYLDYISATTVGSPVSGYASLGPTGGDGSCVMPTSNCAANLASWNTSLARNLNERGFCTKVSGVTTCTVGGVNLLVNSPPVSPAGTYNTSASFVTWDFTDTFEVVVKKTAFGAAGFGTVRVGVIHNSPAKSGSNAITPTPCP